MRKIYNYFVPVLIGLLLIACGNAPKENESDKDSLQEKEVDVNTSVEEKKVELTGKQCFKLESERYSNSIEITISDDKKVNGLLDVYVHDGDYLVTSQSILTGKLEGDSLKLELEIEIEGDVNKESQTWVYKDDKITIDDEVYTKVECKE